MSDLTPAPDPATGARVYELDRAHVFHSWSAQAQIKPMVVAGALGSHIWDYDGNRYLDFSSQLVNVNIGHQHPKVVAAIQEQAARLCTIAPQHANDQRSEAARLIVERAPEGLEKVFFTNGGADAIENAVRMARLHTGRHKVLTTYRSYHGNTATAIQMTGDPRRWANDGGATGVVHFFGPYAYRSPFWSESVEQECERALEHLEQVVAFEGPGTIAALVLETIPGTAGILVPPDGYLAGVREICDRHGIVYVADEVMAGFGRAGEWFAVDRWDVRPDLIAFAKGSNSGYVPLGGVIISAEIAETFAQRVFPGGLTYSGHPLACAASLGTLDTYADEELLTRGAKMAGTFENAVHSLKGLPHVIDIRNIGLVAAVELEPIPGEPGKRAFSVFLDCWEKGLLIRTTGDTIALSPPLIVENKHIDQIVGMLSDAIKRAP